jgi:hypothetical protein
MPSHKANQALQQEPVGSNEDTLRQRCAQLEQQLKACTAELTTAYDRLREETHQRQQLDATLGTGEARYRTLFEESCLVEILRRRGLLVDGAQGDLNHIARVGVSEQIRSHRVIANVAIDLGTEFGGIRGTAIHQPRHP